MLSFTLIAVVGNLFLKKSSVTFPRDKTIQLLMIDFTCENLKKINYLFCFK